MEREMGIPFQATDPAGEQIMAESELVYKSHEKKVKELEGWDLFPFTYMKLEKLRSGYVFKPTVTKMNCNECVTGRANRQCMAKLCKPCCLKKNDQTEKCATHGKTTNST
jgi:hypothetical protein